ncbi:MAG: hypothetical protein K6B44_03715 [Lachnospiraceae bacterium]|nr:hypothetical protein [Lachnospiraceae bacterium]
MAIPLIFAFMPFEARAGNGELVPTADAVIYRDLYHHHSDKCSEPYSYRCRGEAIKTPTGFRNGVRLYSVECSEHYNSHPAISNGAFSIEQMHVGMRRENLTSQEADDFIREHWSDTGHTLTYSGIHCGMEEGQVMGRVSIIHNKELNRLNLRLEGSKLEKVSASFDKGTVWREENHGLGGGDHYILYDANGTYTGTFTYRDHESEQEYTDTISYTITHLPITIKYSIDGVIRNELTTTMSYGAALPARSKPVKTGYRFLGYYLNDVRYYDEECRQAAGVNTGFPDMSVTFTAKWAPEEYTLEYAGRTFKVTYDAAYGSFTPDPSRAPEGYELDRFCIGDIEPFNNDGSPKNQKWIWPVGTSGAHSITEVWKARHFSLKYGDPSANGGEAPVVSEVEYDAAYQAIASAEWNRPAGHEIEGIYVGEEKVFDESGQPIHAKWKWIPAEGDSIELTNGWKPKRYTIYHGPAGTGGKPAWSTTAEYGSEYPAVRIYTAEEKTGYKVDGLYIGEDKIYDGEGEPMGIWSWDFEDRELYPEVRWVPKTGRVTFPGVDDGMEIIYGSDYPPVDVPEPRPGMVFEGYYIGDEQVYDEEGKPTGKWRWDIPDGGELQLTPRWTPKEYSIFFGPDKDGDGIGDIFISVTYGEEYPAITPPVYDDGEVFDGFYCNGELVWDRNGRPTGVWKWDPEEYPLETRTHVLPPPPKEADPTPTPAPDKDPAEDSGQEPTPTPTPTPEPAADNEKDGDPDDEKEPVIEPEKPDNDEETKDDGKEEEDDKGNKKKRKTAPAANAREDDPKEGSEGSGRKTDEESGKNMPPASEDKGTVSENAAVTGPGEDDGSSTKKKKKRSGSSSTVTEESIRSDMQKYDKELQNFLLNKEVTDDTGMVSTVYSELMNRTQDADSIKKQLEERAKSADKAAEARTEVGAAWKEKAVKAAKAGAVTAGSAAGIAAVYAGLVYLFGMAEIYSICPDGRKKRLGKLAINEEGNGFVVNISRNLLNECETNKMGMRLSSFFVSRNKDREMIINNDGRKQQEYVRRDIVVAV